MTPRSANPALLIFTLLAVAATPAQATLFTLAASGTISSSGDATIPNGTPWSFDITYDTAAPDLAPADTTFGQFNNTTAPPALTSFHYQAGSYNVTLATPADFGTASAMHITFTSIHAIDINVFAPTLFPPLAGGEAFFHADFNDFSSDPIFVNDALPTNTALGPGNFDDVSVNLQFLGPPSGIVGGNSLASLTVTAVPEPSTAELLAIGLLLLPVVARRARRAPAHREGGACNARLERGHSEH